MLPELSLRIKASPGEPDLYKGNPSNIDPEKYLFNSSHVPLSGVPFAPTQKDHGNSYLDGSQGGGSTRPYLKELYERIRDIAPEPVRNAYKGIENKIPKPIKNAAGKVKNEIKEIVRTIKENPRTISATIIGEIIGIGAGYEFNKSFKWLGFVRKYSTQYNQLDALNKSMHYLMTEVPGGPIWPFVIFAIGGAVVGYLVGKKIEKK